MSQAEKVGQPADGTVIEKASGGKWIDYDASPKRASAETKKDDAPSGLDGKGIGGPLWKSVGTVSPPASKSPTKSGQTASFGGFGFFSKEEAKAGDKTVLSAAFKKYVQAFSSPYWNVNCIVFSLIFLTNYERYLSFKHV